MPAGPGVRVDTAIRAGERVPPEYDPMIAKILTVGDDRGEAIARMSRALDEVEVTGLQTTLPFHRWLLQAAAFQAASLSTGFVDDAWDGAAAREHVSAQAAQVAAGAFSPAAAPVDAVGPESLSLRTDGTRESSGWRAQGRREGAARWPR
jgi:acetyl/propionyl-CoA carboxylase alpha subunit